MVGGQDERGGEENVELDLLSCDRALAAGKLAGQRMDAV
jgi:hypothetical protein